MAKFCANLAFMYGEKPFIDRYRLAKIAGFKGVESGFPYGFTKEQIVNAKESAGLEQILINIYTGDVTKGELGFAALPGKEQEFRDSLQKTIDLGQALRVKKIHIMSGKIEGEPTIENDAAYEANLRYAVGLLEESGIIGLIEPINSYTIPGYYLNNYDKALDILKKIGNPNLKLMLDLFHLQHIKGNITNTFQELAQFIGHIQIAQVPNRHEPDTAGEINYPYIFDIIHKSGYKDWIGLEYKPETNTDDGLKWLKNYGLTL